MTEFKEVNFNSSCTDLASCASKAIGFGSFMGTPPEDPVE